MVVDSSNTQSINESVARQDETRHKATSRVEQSKAKSNVQCEFQEPPLCIIRMYHDGTTNTFKPQYCALYTNRHHLKSIIIVRAPPFRFGWLVKILIFASFSIKLNVWHEFYYKILLNTFNFTLLWKFYRLLDRFFYVNSTDIRVALCHRTNIYQMNLMNHRSAFYGENQFRSKYFIHSHLPATNLDIHN